MFPRCIQRGISADELRGKTEKNDSDSNVPQHTIVKPFHTLAFSLVFIEDSRHDTALTAVES